MLSFRLCITHPHQEGQEAGTHPARDALDLPGAERLKVHADVALHGGEQLLGGAVGAVGLLPPVPLVPAGDDPLVLAAKHVEVVGLQRLAQVTLQKRCAGVFMVRESRRTLERTYAAEDLGSQVLVKLADDDSHIVVLEKRKMKT